MHCSALHFTYFRRPTKLEAIWHTGASLELEKTKLKLEADRKEIKDLREKAIKLRSDGRDVDAGEGLIGGVISLLALFWLMALSFSL